MKNQRIFFKLSNFLHHLEFEYSGLTVEDMKKIVSDKKILYDHSVKQEEQKYTGRQSLIKVNNDNLPDYLKDNLSKYKNWLD